MGKEQTMYRGIVEDRMGDLDHMTHWHNTVAGAYNAAEGLARRLGLYHSERWTIYVVDNDGDRY